MKKLGIIGGTSWSSTALYYEHINRLVAQRLGGLHSAALAIESLDLAPFAAMQQAGDWDGVANVVVDAAKRLKASGAQALLLASNTAHKVDARRRRRPAFRSCTSPIRPPTASSPTGAAAWHCSAPASP